MGNKCNWRNNTEEPIEINFTVMTDEKKQKGRVLISFLYISLFRKKLKELHKDINNTIVIHKFFKTPGANSKEETLRSGLRNLIADCNFIICKCKLNEFDLFLDEEKGLERTKTEIINFYSFEINKNIEALQKLIYGSDKMNSEDDLGHLINYELNDLFDYDELIYSSKVLMNYIELENRECLSLNLRKFIHKFLYLRIMSNMKCLKQNDQYCVIDRNHIQCILQNAKNLMKQKNEDIIAENYGDVLKHVRFNLSEEDEEALEPKQVKVEQKKSFGNERKLHKQKSVLNTVTPIQKNTTKGFIDNRRSNPASPDLAQKKRYGNGNLKLEDTSEISPGVRKGKRQKSLIENNNRAEVYKGEFDDHNFVYNGMGSLTDRESFIYEGTFRMGKKHGYGFQFKLPYEYEEKIYYRGEWDNDLEDGCGFLVKTEMSIRTFQEGVFEKGVFKHGKQIRIEEVDSNYYISEIYIGTIVDHMYSGEGTLKRKNIKIPQYSERVEIEQEYEYEGQFEKDKENGIGICRKKLYQTGYSYRYQGEFSDGQMQGFGKVEFEGEYYIKTYEGLFLNDKWCCFYGRVEFKSGDIYEGFFDKNHGKSEIGLYFHNYKKQEMKKADHFFGEYKSDKKHGLGKFLIKDTQLLIGCYDDGEKNGNFCLIQEEEEDVRSKNTFGLNKHEKHADHISLKQIKTFYLFENDEGIDKSDKPFKN
jgi:hypothetical protein